MIAPSGWPPAGDLAATLMGLLAAWLALQLSLFALKRRHLLGTFRRMGVPGPRPHPIHGHLYESRREAYVKFAHRLHERFGATLGVYLGGDPYLLTKDLGLIQQVFVARSRTFYDRMNFYLNVEPVPDNLICQRGDRWRYMRRLLTPAFSHGRVKSSRIYRDAQQTLAKFTGQLERNADATGATLVEDLYDRMAAVALDVIVKTAFHMDDMISFEGPTSSQRRGKPAEGGPARNAFLETVKRACRLGFNPLVELIFCFPFLDGPLTFLCSRLYFGPILRLLLDRLDQLVGRRAAADAPDGPHRRRIIDSLIEVLRERKITRSEFTGNAFVIVFAGFETTANALTFTLWLLARHPAVQAKLRAELRAELAKSARDHTDTGDDTRLAQLATGCRYLEMVINESLRLYPPVPGLACRQASEDCTLASGLRLERGVNVVPSVFSIHRDKDIWGESAADFRPERFEMLDEGQLNSAMFMPFGLGPRNCIGKAAAMHEMKIVVGLLVDGYSIESAGRATPEKLRLCSPINITLTSADTIGLKFRKLNH